MRYYLIPILLLLCSFTHANATEDIFSTVNGGDAEEVAIMELYFSINGNMPDLDIFTDCMKGFHQLTDDLNRDKHIITIVDYRMSSNKKRLWVIDLDNNKVLFNSLVAHGQNTGNIYANSFSNISGSHQSSLGFYITGETYTGKHGNSLYLHGVEQGINDNALDRYIVMHGAEYVSYDFIKKNGRLGRSYGCPSLPVNIAQEIIETIKDGTCLFQFYPDQNYISKSKLMGKDS